MSDRQRRPAPSARGGDAARRFTRSDDSDEYGTTPEHLRALATATGIEHATPYEPLRERLRAAFEAAVYDQSDGMLALFARHKRGQRILGDVLSKGVLVSLADLLYEVANGDDTSMRGSHGKVAYASAYRFTESQLQSLAPGERPSVFTIMSIPCLASAFHGDENSPFSTEAGVQADVIVGDMAALLDFVVGADEAGLILVAVLTNLEWILAVRRSTKTTLFAANMPSKETLLIPTIGCVDGLVGWGAPNKPDIRSIIYAFVRHAPFATFSAKKEQTAEGYLSWWYYRLVKTFRYSKFFADDAPIGHARRFLIDDRFHGSYIDFLDYIDSENDVAFFVRPQPAEGALAVLPSRIIAATLLQRSPELIGPLPVILAEIVSMPAGKSREATYLLTSMIREMATDYNPTTVRYFHDCLPNNVTFDSTWITGVLWNPFLFIPGEPLANARTLSNLYSVMKTVFGFDIAKSPIKYFSEDDDRTYTLSALDIVGAFDGLTVDDYKAMFAFLIRKESPTVPRPQWRDTMWPNEARQALDEIGQTLTSNAESDVGEAVMRLFRPA